MARTTVKASADGLKLVASALVGSQSGLTYNSTNGGATWEQDSTQTNAFHILASSADGNKLAAMSDPAPLVIGAVGGIYIAHLTPSPQLNLSVLGASHMLSWIIPSTNLVLQQSSDLMSWVDITNTPTLNLTDLQNEVDLTPTNSSGFYRLAIP
jgi:hypothetical protein